MKSNSRRRPPDRLDGPLGDPARWSTALRSSVNLCLAARAPMAVAWGRELRLVYNDAFRPLLDGAAGGAVGRPASELLATDEPAATLRRVLDGGAAMITGERRFTIDGEETWLSFSCSPITDGDGGPGGVLVVAGDCTARVVGERRLRLLRDLDGACHAAPRPLAETCRALLDALDAHRDALPFALLYLLDDARRPSPADAIGVRRPVPAERWPLAVAGDSDRALDADEVAARVTLDDGQPPGAALIVPIGGPDGARPIALLVAGSARRTLDGGERDFLRLIAARIGAALAASLPPAGSSLQHEVALLRDELCAFERGQRVAGEQQHREFEHAPVAIAVLDGPEHRYQIANARYRQLVDRQHLLGTTLREAFPELEGHEVMRMLDEVYATGRPWLATEYHVPLRRHGAGEPEDSWWNVVVEAIRGPSGAIGGIISVSVDVTEQVQARAREHALRADAERTLALLDAILKTAPIGFSFLDRELRYVRINDWLAAINGVSIADTIGRTVWEVMPEMAAQLAPLHLRVFATGAPVLDQDLSGHTPASPSLRHWQVSYYPVRDPGGEVVLVGAVVVEVTGRKRDAEERTRLLDSERAARAEAEAASRAKDQFLAMLGHELRNPLAPIVTALQLLRLRPSEGGDRERRVIERQVKHLVRLVDDLLNVSRITRGKITLRRERIELAEVVAKAIEMSTPILEERAHKLTVSVPRDGLTVDGDQVRLAQVVANLLTNAAKYSECGGRVELAGAREGEEIVLRVRDSGIGIAPEILPSVFELFVQGERTIERSQGGLGLGLTIVRSLTALHGGTVSAHSDGLGRGSEFVIRLPALADAGARLPAADAPRGRRRAASAGGRRVLVVDDNSDAAELLAAALDEMGHVTRVAYDGPSALEAADDFLPEVALLDIGLPVMDGYELARKLRERPAFSSLRMIAITGYGQETDRRQSREAGFNEHLVKPVDLDDLGRLIG